MASMQANLQLIVNQLNHPTHTIHASPRSSCAISRHDYDFEKEEDERKNFRQSPHMRRKRRIPSHLKEVKIDLPHFHGRKNVEAFLDWVVNVEQLFESHVVEEERRVSLGTLRFQGHALNWWTSLVLQKRRKGLHEIGYWNDLKEALHACHIPSYQKRALGQTPKAPIKVYDNRGI